MNCRMPGFPVHHQLLGLAQIHVHQVSDAIQPSHPLSSSSPFSRHQGIFQWVSCSHQVAKVLELQLQHQSFSEYSGLISFRINLVWSPCCPRDSQEPSPIPQFKNISSSALSFFLWSNSHIYTWPLEKPYSLTGWTFVWQSNVCFFNMLSRLVIGFLPRSKRLLFHSCSHHLQWFWSPRK